MRKVKLLEPSLVRSQTFNHPVVQNRQGAFRDAAGRVSGFSGVGFSRFHRLLLHEFGLEAFILQRRGGSVRVALSN